MGVRRSFREGIRLFCREAPRRCRGRWTAETLWTRWSDSSCAVSGLILETEFNRVGRRPPERLYCHKPSVGVERGDCGLSRPHLEFWGNFVYVDCDGNTFSPCALGPEEAPAAAADPVRRPVGHRDGGPGPPSYDRHGH